MTPRGLPVLRVLRGARGDVRTAGAAFLAALGVPLLIARARPTLLFFLPGALVPIVALFACNYAAIGTLQPAYSEVRRAVVQLRGQPLGEGRHAAAKGIDFNQEPTARLRVPPAARAPRLVQPDAGVVPRARRLVGLGIRSAADVRKLFAGRRRGTGWTPELFAAMTLVVSVVVFAFYLTRTQSYNYGGFTSGPRWLFWLIPLWLLAIPPAADRLAGIAGRAGAVRGAARVLGVLGVLPGREPVAASVDTELDGVHGLLAVLT